MLLDALEPVDTWRDEIDTKYGLKNAPVDPKAKKPNAKDVVRFCVFSLLHGWLTLYMCRIRSPT